MSTRIIALDLERTLISDALSAEPRPGLFDFLSFCLARFERVVLFTSVEQADAWEVLRELTRCGRVPPSFLGRLEYVVWSGEYKDLRFIPHSVPEEVLLVDDDPGWIRPDQRDRWIRIVPWDGGEDAELLHTRSALDGLLDPQSGGAGDHQPFRATRGTPMTADNRLLSERFPRSSHYHPDWVIANASGGANSLWMTEWLTEALDLQPGMRVLDLGCGRACSSIFLRREFGVQVWATDLWFSAAENLQRIRDAGALDGVFPLHADARSLPFAPEFFDAIVSIDSFIYYGTDDLYLNYLARFVKSGGLVGIAGAGLVQEIEGHLPDHLKEWWTSDLWCLHSASWWRWHWERTGILAIERADTMPEGWQLWRDWHKTAFPDNRVEIKTVEADAGRYLGYVRVVGRRGDVKLEEPVVSIPPQYTKHPLLRGQKTLPD